MDPNQTNKKEAELAKAKGKHKEAVADRTGNVEQRLQGRGERVAGEAHKKEAKARQENA